MRFAQSHGGQIRIQLGRAVLVAVERAPIRREIEIRFSDILRDRHPQARGIRRIRRVTFVGGVHTDARFAEGE